MAKMFYTLEEVCERLGMTEDQVREMATSGQIQEFRDRDRLMFKVDQIDLLAGDEDTGDIHLDLEDSTGGSALGLTGAESGLDLSNSGLELADSGAATGLSGSGSGMPLSDSAEGTGLSVFDTDHGSVSSSSSGSSDDSFAGDTHLGELEEEDLSLEAVGSGSGLLDLTRESDDTSLGAELLEEVYSGEDNIEIPANASGLFEVAVDNPEEAVAAAGMAAAMPVMIESYDGSGSGLGVGLLLGALVSLVLVAILFAVLRVGATPELAMQMASNIWMWVGALLGVTVILGAAGFFVGKMTE